MYISFYIIAWILICDPRFHAVLLRQSSGKERKILEKSKKSKKYSKNNVRIVYNSLCVCVCVCVYYICVLLCLVV